MSTINIILAIYLLYRYGVITDELDFFREYLFLLAKMI